MIKGDLTETNNNRKSLETEPKNKESITYLVGVNPSKVTMCFISFSRYLDYCTWGTAVTTLC